MLTDQRTYRTDKIILSFKESRLKRMWTFIHDLVLPIMDERLKNAKRLRVYSSRCKHIYSPREERNTDLQLLILIISEILVSFLIIISLPIPLIQGATPIRFSCDVFSEEPAGQDIDGVAHVYISGNAYPANHWIFVSFHPTDSSSVLQSGSYERWVTSDANGNLEMDFRNVRYVLNLATGRITPNADYEIKTYDGGPHNGNTRDPPDTTESLVEALATSTRTYNVPLDCNSLQEAAEPEHPKKTDGPPPEMIKPGDLPQDTTEQGDLPQDTTEPAQ